MPCVGPDATSACAFRMKLPSDGRSVHLAVYTTQGSEDSRRALRPTSNGSRCITKREVHAVPGRYVRDTCPPTEAEDIESTHVRRGMTMNLSVRSFEFRRFTPGRFHVLLNSLFKVLFNFPSRYLFAIGLAVIFSLRWSLPPT